MKVKAITAILVLAIAHVGTAGLAQALEPANFGTPPVGTKVQWKNMSSGYSWTSTVRESDEPFKYAYFTETGEKRAVYLYCKFCEATSNSIEIDDYAEIYPLSAKSKAKVKRRRVGDSNKSWSHRIKVVREEQIATAFSDEPVDAYVIEEKIYNDQSKWSGKRTFWFAPNLMQNVKIVDDATDDGKSYTYEVQQMILPE